MILDQKVKVKWYGKSVPYYKELGYNFTKAGYYFFVDINDLLLTSRNTIEIRCDYCGDIFKRKYTDYNRNKDIKLKKDACKKCKGRKIVESNNIFYGVNSTSQLENVRLKQIETFKNNNHVWTWDSVCEKVINEGYIMLSPKQDVNAFTKIQLRCPLNHEFQTDIHHFANHGNRCPECAGNIRKTTEQFKQEVHDMFNEEYEVLGEYIHAHHEIQVRHTVCGYEFPTTSARLLLDRQECPLCSKGSSKSERRSTRYLNNNNIIHSKNKKIKRIGLRYDFYIDDNIIIETDGQQHFFPVDFAGKGDEWSKENHLYNVRNDKIKNQYCIDNNIPLIRIPYWEFDNIEYILDNVLHHFNIKKLHNENTYDQEIVKRYLVDSNWNHDTYISWQHKENRHWLNELVNN